MDIENNILYIYNILKEGKMGNFILECDNLCKNYGNKKILKNISIHLNPGDILGFIGPNGARKNYNNKINTRPSKNEFWNSKN